MADILYGFHPVREGLRGHRQPLELFVVDGPVNERLQKLLALAAERGVLLEITTRAGHAYANGHVATMARAHGAKVVVNNDAHAPRDLVDADLRRRIALGCGMTADEYLHADGHAWALVSRSLSL